MSNDLGSALKSNWYLIVAAVVLIGGGIAAGLMGGDDGDDSAGVVQQAGGNIEVVSANDVNRNDGGETRTSYVPLTDSEKDAQAVENYEKEIAESGDDNEIQEKMIALANVHKRMGDLDSAILVWEDFLDKYPDAPGTRAVLIALSGTYESMGEYSLARQTYERMVDYFPPDAQEHMFAKQKLETL